GQDVVFVGPRRSRPGTRNRLALFVDEQDRVSSALVEIGEIFSDHQAVGVEPGAVADSIARIGGLIAVGRIALHAQIRAPRLVPLPRGGCQSLASPIGARQAASMAGFTLGARNKTSQAGVPAIRSVTNSVPAASNNHRQHRDYKQ